MKPPFCLKCVICLIGACALVVAAEQRSPLTPQQAQTHFRLDPGLRIELAAAEPEVQSPVAMCFDEDGRLWVVEMLDYPNGPQPGRPPEGRIKILEDRNGDGRYEQARVFAEGLLFANGLLRWRDGVLVTAAPHIVHLRDTDGDGQADRREVLYEGFAVENPQLRVSHPILGMDNWVYVVNGLRGGKIKRPGRAETPLDISGLDFRFDPVNGRYEAVTGMGQYGNTFDDWGNRFVCTNRNHLIPIVLPDRYVRRNPFLAPPEPVRDNQGAGGAARVYPLSKNWTTSNLHAGTFSAACGVFIYRGSLLPATYRGAAFTCDPTGNLIHMETLSPDGVTFRGKPAREGVEFLATPDDWCRPVFLTSGPDGALYFVDMYRAVIEHPEWMPPELRNRPDLLWGKDKGRIWRIVPADHQDKSPRPRLSRATVLELVALLEHVDAWWRTTAQRLLLERQDRTAVEPLRRLARQADKPLARLHAAWLLAGLGELDDDTVLGLLQHEHPRLREHGVALAEQRLKDSITLREQVIALADNADARVRFQVALSLGEWDDDQILPPLARIALAGAEDSWTRMAVATAVPQRAGALVTELTRRRPGLTARATPGRLALLRELATLIGARRDTEEIATLLQVLSELDIKDRLHWQAAGLNGLSEGLARRGEQMAAFVEALSASRRPLVEQVNRLLAEAATVAGDLRRSAEERLAAVRLLAHAPWSVAEKSLPGLLTDDEPQVRLAAVRAIAAQPRAEVASLLLGPWRGYSPAVRREVLEAVLSRTERTLTLLQAIEAGQVKPNDLDALRSRQLLNSKDPAIRDRARRLLQNNLPADRKQVLERYRAALSMPGDAGRGRMVFQKHCATCHRVAGLGVDVGPDVSDTRTKTSEQLLLDILDPNAAIDSNFVNFTVTTKSGRVLTGILVAETSSSITLRRAESQTDVVLRQDVEEIQSTGVSLMPEGLERSISVAELADLVAFLKNWRYLDGSIPIGK